METFYGNLKSLQDNLIRCCLDRISVQYGFDRFENLAETKLLQYNLSKTVVVIMGKGKARKRLKEKFKENPPTLYGKPVKIEEQWSYLGEQLGISVSSCITLTLNKRIGIVKKSIFEIKCMV